MVEQERVTPKPEEIIRANVTPEEVGRYYIKSELSRIFPGPAEFRAIMDKRVDELEGEEFWRLFEALSFSFRLNGVFHFVGNSGFSWGEEKWKISQLTLNRVNPDINAVTYSAGIGRSPIKFRDYLREYFADHPQDDPKKLGQFRPNDNPVNYPRVLLREENGEITLLDGTNRLMKLMFLSQKEVVAFVGRKTGKEGRVRIGDSTFLRLRNLYEKGDKNQKAAVLKVVRMLLDISLDGSSAVENYWVRHARDETSRGVGKRLLKSKPRKPQS
jgi:hypothetical protein